MAMYSKTKTAAAAANIAAIRISGHISIVAQLVPRSLSLPCLVPESNILGSAPDPDFFSIAADVCECKCLCWGGLATLLLWECYQFVLNVCDNYIW